VQDLHLGARGTATLVEFGDDKGSMTLDLTH
jgi:hypothetical protein